VTIDLDAYFLRIGYAGGHAPTLDTLRRINALHAQAIAFENLDPLLKWPVALDARSLEQKLVRNGRGGYCYEHNLLFSHVLKSLGFKVKELAGRVVWQLAEDAVTPRTHVVLHVEIDGQTYIVDVGFGSCTLTSPLRLETNVAQATPHGAFRLIEAGEDFVMQVRIRDQWIALYRFDLREQFLPDHEVGNWYTSTHPNSRFVTDLMIARTDPDCRHTLRNAVLAVHHSNGLAERRKLGSTADLREALTTVFRITLPDTQYLAAIFERAVRQAA
jgi:N-hydroxyarylamine O-acetyltransferase